MTNNSTFTKLPGRSKSQIRECVVLVRLSLYNAEMPCGPDAIQKDLEELNVFPIPSRSTISRILKQECLTHRRTGYYEGEVFGVLG